MKNGSFKGDFQNSVSRINVGTAVFVFVENEVHIVFSPYLDISGYGNSEKEALESFQFTLSEFLDYGTKKNTLHQELKRLGWDIVKKKKINPPKLSELIQKNKYLEHIIDSTQFTRKKYDLEIPCA